MGRRPSAALVISVAALVLALGAGAYAVTKVPKNSVVSKSIRNGQVKAKDLAADVPTQGPTGDPGPAGPAGTARGYAFVDPNPLSMSRSKGFASVTPSPDMRTGLYCLQPAAGSGLDPAQHPAFTSVEWAQSAADREGDGSALWNSGGGACPSGTYAVQTERHGVNAGNNTPSQDAGDVAFVIVVP